MLSYFLPPAFSHFTFENLFLLVDLLAVTQWTELGLSLQSKVRLKIDCSLQRQFSISSKKPWSRRLSFLRLPRGLRRRFKRKVCILPLRVDSSPLFNTFA
jgi:hypothetical protein